MKISKGLVWFLAIFIVALAAVTTSDIINNATPVIIAILSLVFWGIASLICKDNEYINAIKPTVDTKSTQTTGDIPTQNNQKATTGSVDANTTEKNKTDTETVIFEDFPPNVPDDLPFEDIEIEEERTISKSKSIKLCNMFGVNIYNLVTFASANKFNCIYWANPKISLLNYNWTLILNDNIKHQIHVFNIPAYTLSRWSLKTRSDNENLIDLQINYNDTTFQDTRSKIRFSEWLVETIDY